MTGSRLRAPISDDLDAAWAALARTAQEPGSERFGLAVANGHAEYLAAPVSIRGHREDDRDRDDVAVAAWFDVGHIELEICGRLLI